MTTDAAQRMTIVGVVLYRGFGVRRYVAETRTLESLLNYALDEAISLTGADRGYMVILWPNDSVEVRAGRDRAGCDLPDDADQISKSILKRVAASGEPLIIADASADPDFNQAESVHALKLRSVMCVPLISHGVIIGAIYVENRTVSGRFLDNDLPPLILFANQAAVSIENAALNDDLEARVTMRTRQLEEAMRQSEQSWNEAIEGNRLRTALLGNVAHDLRAPLSIVYGTLSVLQDNTLGELNAAQAEWVAKAIDALTHVLSLTNDLIDLSILDLGVLQLYKQGVMLGDFLQNIYNIGRGLPWPEGVELKLDLAAGLPEVWCDPIRIRQVLLNLFSNALKFTRRGSVTLHAHQLSETAEVLVGVADTGDGLLPEEVDQIFQRFQQVDKDPQRRRKGVGLGLAISRELVEMHGGRIWVESKPGEGSNFMFTLPVDEA